jgi:hypothetical protein
MMSPNLIASAVVASTFADLPPDLELPGSGAILVSPRNVPAFLIRIPRLREKHREGAIRFRLRSLYPGDAAGAELDYMLLPGASPAPDQGVLVFARDKAAAEKYRHPRKALVPGIALMILALKKYRPGKDDRKSDDGKGDSKTDDKATDKVDGSAVLVMFITPGWIEAARFEGRELRGYIAVEKAGAAPPFFPAALSAPGESGPPPTLLILWEAGGEEPYVEALGKACGEHRVIPLGDLLPDLNVKRAAIFKPRGKPGRRSGAATVLLLLNSISVLFSLRMLTGKAEANLAKLEGMHREMVRYQPEATAILREIGELRERAAVAAVPEKQDTYALIAEIQSRLAGAWVRSFSLQKDRFSLDAEGADSLGVLEGLRGSPYLYDIVLHQAAPSSLRGESFSISGSVRHGKK